MDALLKVPRNWDLLVPFVLVFLYLRTGFGFGDIPMLLFHGIAIFLPLNHRYAQLCCGLTPIKGDRLGFKIPDTANDLIESLKIKYIDFDGFPLKVKFLKDLPMYRSYETLIGIAVCAILSHYSSMIYRILVSDGQRSAWATIIAGALVVLAAWGNIQVAFLTGYRSGETKIAVWFGFLVLIASSVLLFGSLPVSVFGLETAFQQFSEHLIALAKNLIGNAEIRPEDMMGGVNLIVALCSTMLAVSVGIPAIRFSQIFRTLVSSTSYERASNGMMGLLVLDFILPIVITAIFYENSWVKLDDKVLLFGMAFTATQQLSLQLGVAVMWITVHIFCLRTYIQSFLLATIRMCAIYKASGSSAAYMPQLHEKTAARAHYIVCFALQFLTLAFIPLGLVIVIHRCSSDSTGFIETAAYLMRVKVPSLSEPLVDATKVALESAAQGPYLSDLTHAMVGVNLASEQSLVAVIRRLIIKFADLQLMPTHTAAVFAKSAMCVFCGLWSLVSILAHVFWLVHPTTFELIAGGAVVSVSEQAKLNSGNKAKQS